MAFRLTALARTGRRWLLAALAVAAFVGLPAVRLAHQSAHAVDSLAVAVVAPAAQDDGPCLLCESLAIRNDIAPIVTADPVLADVVAVLLDAGDLPCGTDPAPACSWPARGPPSAS